MSCDGCYRAVNRGGWYWPVITLGGVWSIGAGVWSVRVLMDTYSEDVIIWSFSTPIAMAPVVIPVVIGAVMNVPTNTQYYKLVLLMCMLWWSVVVGIFVVVAAVVSLDEDSSPLTTLPTSAPLPTTPQTPDQPVLSPEAVALGAFYDAANGVNWLINTNWKTDTHVCTWYGVVCDNDNKVVGLSLKDNNMHGVISPSIGELTDLVNIDFDSNYLGGEIPSEIANLQNLRRLELDDNYLTGSIPSFLAEIKNIKEIYLQVNKFTGPVPQELCAKRDLRGGELDTLIMDCAEDGSQGIVCDFPECCTTCILPSTSAPGSQGEQEELPTASPEVVSQGEQEEHPTASPEAVALGDFYDAANGINWSVNTNWKTNADVCTWYGVECDDNGKVVGLNLKNNNMHGTISPSIGQLTDLVNIDLDSNYLGGEIPTEIGNLLNLRRLELDDNNLSGSIPGSLANIKNIKEIYLQNNNFSGMMPLALCAKRDLKGGELDTLIADCDGAGIAFGESFVVCNFPECCSTCI